MPLLPFAPDLTAAYFGDDLPPEAAEVVAAAPAGESVDELRARLDRIYRQPAASTSGRCADASGVVGVEGGGASSGRLAGRRSGSSLHFV